MRVIINDLLDLTSAIHTGESGMLTEGAENLTPDDLGAHVEFRKIEFLVSIAERLARNAGLQAEQLIVPDDIDEMFDCN